jgi:hypothetical protein
VEPLSNCPEHLGSFEAPPLRHYSKGIEPELLLACASETISSPTRIVSSFKTCFVDQAVDNEETETDRILQESESTLPSIDLSGFWTSSRAPNRGSDILFQASSKFHHNESSNESERPPSHTTSLQDVFRRPGMTPEDMIITHFYTYTCGIMSIKDGNSENPWRTLMWPLAQASPALYHAIFSMTAFHMVREYRGMRIIGLDHQRKACRFLIQGIQHQNICNDAALATTLVLAFSEVFDNHTTLGYNHLLGARRMLENALGRMKSNTGQRDTDLGPYSVADRGSSPVMQSASETNKDLQKNFHFLYNVWVYLDVLAKLTSFGDDDPEIGFEIPHQLNSQGREIDPLLGCAVSLFPIIGKVGKLIQHVRNPKAGVNAKDMVNQAKQLQSELELWEAGNESSYEPPVDKSNHVAHCISTAQAYRLATLLYLQQAVPETQDYPAHVIAQQIMSLIFSIPNSSRSCIVHIYPLVVAGCEAVDEERILVSDRWRNMTNRMWIGNVDKAWAITKEVWQRRDAFIQKNGCSPYDNVSGQVELAVRGSLHWARVMKDNEWEGWLSFSCLLVPNLRLPVLLG